MAVDLILHVFFMLLLSLILLPVSVFLLTVTYLKNSCCVALSWHLHDCTGLVLNWLY